MGENEIDKGADKALLKARPWWQKLLGLRRRQRRYVPWGLTLWGKIVFLAVIGLGGMAGFAEYSMQPDFCRSCHIMEPYYEAWHRSTHKNVPCTDCHFPPGIENTLYGKFQASSQAVKYITKTYASKPHAEIQDAACLRPGCHDAQKQLYKWIHWTVPTTDGRTVTIRYNHEPHLTLERRGMHLRCVSCHSQIVQGQHLTVTVSTCFLCHFKGLKHGRDDQTVGTCKGCHDAPQGVLRLTTGNFNHADYAGKGVKCENCHADTVRGDGAVPKQVCWNCHNQPGQIAQYGETQVMHDEHVTKHKVECTGCHVEIEHNLPDEKAMTLASHASTDMDNGSCGLCHEMTHLGPREMFFGTGGRGVPDMPSPMARVRVQCIACHTLKATPGAEAAIVGQTYVASQQRCDYCHGQKYPTAVKDWTEVLAAEQAKAEAALSSAAAAVGKARLDPQKQLDAQRLIDDASYNVRFVKLAFGVHNIVYATACLNMAEEKCRQAEALAAGKVAQAQ